MELKFNQIDRAVATLEYLSTRTKEVKGENGNSSAIPNPCTFAGDISWDLASNEAAMRDVMTVHAKMRRSILQKHIADGMDPQRPTAAFLQETSEHDDTTYNIEIIMIPVAALKAEENKIPNSYRAAIRFMIDFAKAPAKEE